MLRSTAIPCRRESRASSVHPQAMGRGRRELGAKRRAVIESSAAQLCAAIDGNPTDGGVFDGMASLQNRGLDETDGALVLITAVHHVCPQHEPLVMGTMSPLAAEELCNKPL